MLEKIKFAAACSTVVYGTVALVWSVYTILDELDETVKYWVSEE